MKRKESIEKAKPSKDLANQLKARLFDKGNHQSMQDSVTALYHRLNDKSKIITKPQTIKTVLW